MSTDIIERIDQAVGCQRCKGPLGKSPSDCFCSEVCQTNWHAERVGAALAPPTSPFTQAWRDVCRQVQLQWTPIVNAIGYELDRGRGDYFAPDYPYMHALSEPQLTMLLSDGSRRLVPSNVWREATPIQIRTTDGSGSLPQQIADALNVAAERLGLPNRRPWIGPVGEEWNGREWEPLPGTRP